MKIGACDRATRGRKGAKSGSEERVGQDMAKLLKTNVVAWPGLAFTLLQAKVDWWNTGIGAARKGGNIGKARPGQATTYTRVGFRRV